MRDTVIIGIDPGTQRAAWCVGRGRRYVASGSWKLGSGDVWTRLGRLPGLLLALFSEWQPVAVGCELPMPNKGNQHTNRVLGAAVGHVQAAAAMVGARFVTVNPLMVRRTGFHKKTVKQTQAFTGKDGMTPDEADAVGVWWRTAGLMEDRG